MARQVALGDPAALLAAILVLMQVSLVTSLLPELTASCPLMSHATAQVLDHSERVIPASAEVITSDGLAGHLSTRRFVYP